MTTPALTRDQLVKAVAAGFSDSEIAEHLGVTPSAISQAITKYEVREAAAILNKGSRFESIDDSLNDIEEIVTKKLRESVLMMADPMKMLQVLRVVNGAKRRSLAEGQQPNQVNNIAILNLPERATVQYTKNEQNEVIEIDGRPMITMQAGRLLQHVKESQKTTKSLGLPPTNQKTGGRDDLTGQAITEML